LARGPSTPADGVFINCPFDEHYSGIFRALIFTIYVCEFRPRSARELDDAGQTRIEKLIDIIAECRFGIHDISRTELDDANRLLRFNMPLELGIFLGAKRFGNKAQRQKRLLIFDKDQYRYQKFISDLAGMDIHAHGSDPKRAILETRDWLATASRRQLASGDRIVRLHAKFLDNLPEIARTLEFDVRNIPYVDFERIVVNWLLEKGSQR